MSTAYERICDTLRDAGHLVKENGHGKAMCTCPGHHDRNPSLSITAIEGSVLIYCHAGCDTDDVLSPLNMTRADLYDERNGATYTYPDNRRVHRSPAKQFRQSGNTKGTALFHADRIETACLVYVTEGEKDVLAIESAGGTAVCPAMGAGKAHRFDWSPLKGLDVVIVADNDQAGRKHARQVVGLLEDITLSTRTVRAAEGKDAADHIAAGYGLHEFVAVQTEAKDHAPPAEAARFFDQHGLRVQDLAEVVTQSVTCGFGSVDERFYIYDRGVWVPNSGRIEAEIGRMLGNRYRNSHARNVLDMIRYSAETPRITCDPVPRFVNVTNGMIDWASGRLLPHSPRYCSTVQLPVAYDENATCPQFDEFLVEVLPEDCLAFIWELIGYTLYSGNPLHLAVLLYGKGRNGKGTLIRVLKRLLGERNCSTVGLHELTENRFRAATLFGKLANLAGDLDSRWLANTATFKAITGCDCLQGERKYSDPFDFTPWTLPFYSTNRAFGSADSSEGWVARWLVVPFPASFIGREDRSLDARLTTEPELRGILAGGIAALPALMARGRFDEPASVREAKRAFVAASDVVRSWIDERCVLEPDAWSMRSHLYQDYRTATTNDGSKQLSAREFYNRLEQIDGVHPVAHRTGRGFRGVRLRCVAEVAGVAGSPIPNAHHGRSSREPATPATPLPDLGFQEGVM